MQLGLFGQSPQVRFDPRLRGVQRSSLAFGAWIDHLPGWIHGHANLFDRLREEVSWQETTQTIFDREVVTPRLIATFGEARGTPFPLLEMADALSLHYRVRLDRISVALYRDGRDSVAFHRDREHRERFSAMVAIVSVGAPRRFVLRPRLEAGPSIVEYRPGWGDLLVMGGTCQRTWEHSVPKQAYADPRISIMFRHEPGSTPS